MELSEHYFNNILPTIDMTKFYNDSYLDPPTKTMVKYKVGEIYQTRDGLKYKIIKAYKGNSKRLVRFLKTGYLRIVESKDLNTGIIHDPFYPSFYGVGVIGEEYFTPRYSKNTLYQRWTDMLSRCYNPLDPEYEFYGGNGVYVSNEWLYYPNYKKDISNKENFNKLTEGRGIWHIDKDKLSGERKIYSNETTQIIHISENTKLRNTTNELPRRKSKIVLQFDKENQFIKKWASSSEASKSIYNSNNYTHKHINSICNKNYLTKGQYKAYGFIWRYEE